MQIESITPEGLSLMVTFTDGKNSSSFSSRDWLNEITILRRIREAERDLAYLEYGDLWRSHIKPKNFWTDPPDAEEQALIDQIREAINADGN